MDTDTMCAAGKQCDGGGLEVRPEMHANAFTALTQQLCLSDTAEVYGILKNSLMPGANDSDIAAFAITCAQYKLNPFVKEVYAFPTKGGGIQPMVSIDGWLKIAHNHPDFDGMAWLDGGEADDRWCECTVFLKSTPDHPVTVREYMQECKMNTEPWKTRPRRMLRHRATIQAIRYAFGVAGVSDKDDFYDDYQEAPKPGSMQMRQAVGKTAGGLTPAKAGLPLRKEAVAPEAECEVVSDSETPAGEPEPDAQEAPLPPVALPQEKVAGGAGTEYVSTGAFDRLNAMLKERGKRWTDCSRVLQACGVQVPLGQKPAEMDKFAAWVLEQKPLLAELEAKLGVKPNLI